jgi:3',5'-cyclic AMP phosphodiesterase CpdA
LVPKIRVVVLTGDATERALPEEFRQTTAFINTVLSALDLTSGDLLVVPGNHDVNWKDCEAYFNRREGSGLVPLPPHSPKWSKFKSFKKLLTGDGSLHSVVNRSDLDTSFVLINSTVRETHQEHFGWCGEDQLRDLAADLATNGLSLRIGLLHHNVRRRSSADDENLLDEMDLTRILGPHLNLVLHGHTHDGRRDYLSDGTLVLSTGSAAVSGGYRPEEVSNQYQVVAIREGQVQRWSRRYETSEKRFVPDSRVGTEATPGNEVISFLRSGSADGRKKEPKDGMSRKARLRLGEYGEQV